MMNKKIIEAIHKTAEHFNSSIKSLSRDQFRTAYRDNLHNVPDSDIKRFGGWNRARYAANEIAIGSSYEDLQPAERITGPVSTDNIPVDAVPEGYFIKNISTQVDDNGDVERQWIRAPLVQESGEIQDQIPEGHLVKGVSTLVSGDGHILAQWTKTTVETKSKEVLLEELLRDLPTRIPTRIDLVELTNDNDRSDDLLAVYPMGDPHIGMLSWAPETGEDFNLTKAKKIMCGAMSDLVRRGPSAKNALIINLGDFFHSDNEQNRTSRSGHALDVDGRWQKVLRVGLEIMVYMIDQALATHENVTVINEIGNHDDHSAMFLSVALDAYYRNEPRINIDLSPSRFHWFRFGKCLIGVTHGHNQKSDSLESIMAAERSKDWGETDHRFWYCGHIHHIVKKEMRGCMIESFRTLSPRDAWSANAGYKSGRDMNRITLHKDFGEVGRETVNASYLKSAYNV